MLVLTRKKRFATAIIPSDKTGKFQQKMWELYNCYYKVDPTSFFARFDSNDYYALYQEGDQLVGFTGFRLKEVHTEYGSYMTFYIGQSIIDENFRNRSLIAKTCVRIVTENFFKNPLKPLFLWCDSLTYKPYLAFAKATTEYYPTYKKTTPPHVKAIMNELGRHYYGDNYDSATGTVRKDKIIVADPSTEISDEDRQHPDIDFFTKANKNYRQGHGLLTIVPASSKNFLYCLKRCLRKQLGL